MKNKLLKVSLKYGLILGGFSVIIVMINWLTFNPGNYDRSSSVISGILSLVLLLVFIPMAHYEYNKKNGNYISFKDAILIGLIILGIPYIISTVEYFISYEFILKDKIQQHYSNMSNEYGGEIYEKLFSFEAMVLPFLFSLLVQVLILFLIITVESQWKIYKKAGKDGWAAIIPIYNIVVLLEIVKKPTWWLLMLLIPFVNMAFLIWIANLLAKRFNKDEGFALGLIFLPFIFYPLLGMSKAEYIDG